jgi:S1-C subfamily serine protease
MKYFICTCLLILTLNKHSTAAPTDEKSSQLPTVINSQILQNSLAASVQITSRAVENASSAQTLGKVRQGSGVVIGSDGLILTIGYLILETEQIEIRTHQQKTYPAQVVAYDQATGFGLIKSLIPLQGVEPVKLGKLNDQKIDSALLVVSAGDSAF